MTEEIMKLLKGLKLDSEVFNEDTMKEISVFIEAKIGEFKQTTEEEL